MDWIVGGTHPLAGHYYSKAEFLAHTFSAGRDLELNPSQHVERLNYLIFPYVELDGKAYPNVANAFSFNDVIKTSRRSASRSL